MPPTMEASTATAAISSNSSDEMAVSAAMIDSSMAPSCPAVTNCANPLGLLRRLRSLQIRRRDQHAEALAPDDHARVFREIDARRDRIALAALERAQPAEIDEHDVLHVGRGADRRFRHQVDMERRARA